MANWTIEKRWGVYHVYKPDGQLSLRLLTLDALGVHLSMCMEEIERLRAENARLTRERDEARKAARWMLPFVALDGAGYGRVHEACQRWPWLEDMEAPE